MMKAHVGVDSRTKLVHTVLVSAANVADCHAQQHLLHGNERRVWGDWAYCGRKAAIREGAPRAKDFTHQRSRSDERVSANGAEIRIARRSAKTPTRKRASEPTKSQIR